MNEVELAWAAGFFDGEGCVWVRPSEGRRKPKVYISVNQVDVRPLERFLKAVDAGQITGPVLARRTGPSKGNEQPVYKWCCYPQDIVEIVLEKLFPYMSQPKKEQAIRCFLVKAEHYAALEGRCPVHTPYERCNRYCVWE